MLSVHVDDQLTACNSRSALDAFKHTLNNKFECSDSGLAGYFLGFEIDRHASFIYLNNITLRQYLTDLTWLIAILHGVLFHTDFDQYQLRMKNTRRHDTVHTPRQLTLSSMRPL